MICSRSHFVRYVRSCKKAKLLSRTVRCKLFVLYIFIFRLNYAPWMEQYLNEDELNRARRYLLASKCSNFIASRARLKILLCNAIEQIKTCNCLSVSSEPIVPEIAQQLHIDVYKDGKPYLPDYPHLIFNLSHSDNLAVLGLAYCPHGNCEIGVDLEKISADRDHMSIAERFFHPEEFTAINLSADRACKFTEIWTKKESYLKMLGTGLKTPLNSFSVLEDKNIHSEILPHNYILSYSINFTPQSVRVIFI